MKQKQQKIIILIVILSSVVFSSCVLSKNSKTLKASDLNMVIVSGIVQRHTPYCGGAYPPPELENGTLSAITSTKFYIVLKADSSRTPVDSFTTSDNGSFQVTLKKNKYSIFSAPKILPFEEFYKQNSGASDSLYSDKGKSCYKNWYNTPELSLNAVRDTFVQIILYSYCFTGDNPCIMYTGPLPQ